MIKDNKLNTHWQNLATKYDKIMSKVSVMQKLCEKIIHHIPDDVTKILDLGTGTGMLISHAHHKFPNATFYALDLSTSMLAQAKIKLAHIDNIHYINSSAHDLKEFDAETFDCVISNYALHHLTHKQKEICVKEIYRVLKPNAKLIYGDQHCAFMGTPDNVAWLEHLLDLLTKKAKHYLASDSIERMLLQVELMPKFLRAEEEIIATVDFWLTQLKTSGFQNIITEYISPRELMNCVIIAEKHSNETI